MHHKLHSVKHSLPLLFRSLFNMEKRKLKDKDEAILLQHPVVLFLILVLGFVIMDPLQIGPLGGHEFKPVKHSIAPYKKVMERWPRDNMSRLGLGKLEFEDEVFGPESLEFDALGLGPYTGLADGRVVRWMGPDVGWETFALVTANWYVCYPHQIILFFLKLK